MWRITDDFWDSWPLLKAMFERCEVWQNHVSPGCWPDCDMLPVGRVGACFKCFGSQEHTTNLTADEQYTLMNLWCIFRSPLMIGAELTKLDDFTRALLTNDEVLALTKNGAQARLVSRTEETAVWATRAVPCGGAAVGGVCLDGAAGANPAAPAISSGAAVPASTADFYVALFNLSDERREVSVSVAEVLQTFALAKAAQPKDTPEEMHGNAASTANEPAIYSVRDLWQHKETGTVKSDGILSAELAPHASLLVRVHTNT